MPSLSSNKAMWNTTIVILVILFIVILIWRSNLRAREQAIYIAKQTCKKINVQLLDDTVALKKTRLTRSDSGSICWLRNYEFEYSTNDIDRNLCTIQLKGYQLVQVFYDEKQHTTIVSENTNSAAQNNDKPSYSNNVINFTQYKDKNTPPKDEQ